MAVHEGLLKVKKSDSHWVGGAGQQAASGRVQVQSEQWLVGVHDGQS